MTNLVYIGNKLISSGKTATTIDTLGTNLEASGFKITYASSYKNIFLRLIHMLWTVFKHRQSTDYVLIDTYSTLNFYYAYAVSKLCKILGLKYIPILHGGNLPIRLIKNPKLSATIFKNAYVNIAPSNYIKASFKEKGYINVEVIPNSIDIINYPFLVREIDTIDLLWVRSFSNLYNPKLAINVLSELKKKGYNCSLCMVGPDNDGSLQEVKKYASNLGLEVSFTGKLTKEEWIALSKNYNVFINTTNFDNTPVSVIEAMALGLPIVSTHVGGLPFLIDNTIDGQLVPANDVKAFVKAVLYYKNNPKWTQSVITSARNKSEQFNWNTVKQKWISTLK
ncbi:glycosyltransferase family 4 protein [Olleya sp. Hel_I_94]|jgi:glycosyltransferase involved in cell wall biosynthesis|uniref:glycosyltransferase family 4 protein n=1 Tax=Olleya sp. Hel_I_94 TaxID=1250001 RepID=UPI00119F453E|nr:glycosyltransferase family 4 protein [Olleya sp. Hel_I_94]TVZ49656.1 glycosyltransferase involved in cell wall biosynthesis [Olleya sp. Hel_I_94]